MTNQSSLRCGVFALIAVSLSTVAFAQDLSHLPDATLHDGFDGISGGPSFDGDASRFLAQATFGPTVSVCPAM